MDAFYAFFTAPLIIITDIILGLIDISEELFDKIYRKIDNYAQNKPFRLLSLVFIGGPDEEAHGDLLTIGSYGLKYCEYSTAFYFVFFNGIKIKYDAKNWDSFYLGYSYIAGVQD